MALAAVAKPGVFQRLGVTRTLNVTYLKPVKEGMRVVVGNEVISVGGRLAIVTGWIREVDGAGEGEGEGEGAKIGAVRMKGGYLAMCEHGKVNTDPPSRGEKGEKSRL